MAPRDWSMGTSMVLGQGGVYVPLQKTHMTLLKYKSETDGGCYATWVDVVVFSAVDMPQDAKPIPSATVTLIQDKILLNNREIPKDDVDAWLLKNAEEAKRMSFTVPASELKVQKNNRGVLVGGFRYFGSASKLLVTADGFFPEVYSVKLQGSQYLRRIKIFLIPDDGRSRVILRWGNQPADCDIYVVPNNVVDPTTNNPVAWRTNDGKRARHDPPYVFFDLCNCFGCECDAPVLQGASDKQTAVITLGRDDTTHGIEDEDGSVANGPETMSLLDLLPGKYLVYINAGVSTDGGLTYPSFKDKVKVEIALGNGTYSARGPSIEFDPEALGGGKWYFAGYFHVTLPSDPVCEPDFMDAQDGSRKSLLHHAHGLCYTYVVTGKMVKFTIQRVNQALAAGISPVPNVQYVLDGGNFFRGVPRQHDPQEIPTVLRFKAPGYATEIIEFDFFRGEWAEVVQAWMVQDDGKTHVVMRWRDYPGDLDLYIVPLGVHGVDEDQTPVEWTIPTCGSRNSEGCGAWVEPDIDGKLGGLLNMSQAYLWYRQKELKGRTPDVDFVAGETLEPLLTQQRDDSGHAPPTFGDNTPWPNGPEAMTLQNLLPGTYEVYITAYDPNDQSEQIRSGLTVDIFIGDGYTQMRKADSIQLFDALDGAKWFHVGRFVVTYGDACAPDGTSYMWQSTASGRQTKFCYTWYSAGAVFSSWNQYLFQVSSIRDAATSDILISAKYVLDSLIPSRVQGLIHKVYEGQHMLEMRMPGYITTRSLLSFVGGFDDHCSHDSMNLRAFDYFYDQIDSLEDEDGCISREEWRAAFNAGYLSGGSSITQDLDQRFAEHADPDDEECVSWWGMRAYVQKYAGEEIAGYRTFQKSLAAERCHSTHWVNRFTGFLVPDDGYTRIVLKWGDKPADLDTYVVPSHVETLDGDPVYWKAELPDGNGEATEWPYVYWGLCDLCDECDCEDRTLIATASPASTAPLGGRISLDRDDRVHGSPDALGINTNGPETTTFRNLLPGRYDVYINVYEEAERFHGEVTVEAYLGNGISSCLVDIVQCTLTNGRWFHAGYFVAYTSETQLERLLGGPNVHIAGPTYTAEEEQVLDPSCTAMNATRLQLRPDNGYNVKYKWVPVGIAVENPAAVTSGPEELSRRRHQSHLKGGKGKAHRAHDPLPAHTSAAPAAQTGGTARQRTDTSGRIGADKRRGGGRRARRKGVRQVGAAASGLGAHHR